MRNLIVGDIHGMYDELMRVLEASGYSDSDRLICLGDYINRGEQSREVMEFLIEAKGRNHENVYLQGNHEEVLLSALSGEYYSLASWLDLMQGREAVESYSAQVVQWGFEDPERFVRWVFPAEHLQLLREMPESFALGKYRFVHDAEDAEDAGQIIIYAHEHNRKPKVGRMRICLGMEGRVALLDLDKMVIIDSDGVRYDVDVKLLLGALYTEYF